MRENTPEEIEDAKQRKITHGCETPETHNAGCPCKVTGRFSEEFIRNITCVTEAVVDGLLRSKGWRELPTDVTFTHAQLEAAVDTDELAREFEYWLDAYLNGIDPTKK